MIPRIGPRRALTLFLAEWREEKGLTQQELGDRLDKSDVTISRWETGKRKPSDKAKADIAYALGIDPVDLYRHPKQPSADALLRGQPPEVIDQALKVIIAIRR
jgi:transcriptional regulator with XRE-family HTH domain